MLFDGPAWTFLGILGFASTALSFYLMLEHWFHYSQPRAQRKIVSIVWMVPIYSLCSWWSLRFTRHSPYLNIFRDCYEAYVIYAFFHLCSAYIGCDDRDPNEINISKIERVLQDRVSVSHLSPFNFCFPPINLRTGSYRFFALCRLNILQFVIVKPLCAFAALILGGFGIYDEEKIGMDSGYVYVAFVDNVSVSASLYFLVLYYMATKSGMSEHSPFAKFVCIKIVLFFSFWQSMFLVELCALGILQDIQEPDGETYTCNERATAIQNSLVVVQMFALAVAHIRVFSAAPYIVKQAVPRTPRDLLPIESLDVRKEMRDVRRSLPHFQPGSTPMQEQLMYNPSRRDFAEVNQSPRSCTRVEMTVFDDNPSTLNLHAMHFPMPFSMAASSADGSPASSFDSTPKFCRELPSDADKQVETTSSTPPANNR
eukprot:TRINITY_DN50264_c0_g1_i1.p1 TRINITY_DN50264_c0_g1~~TRINITY_DN50264_c0_g1_i1.p1  ORF type:complete len:427 (-),score=35.45 TRINITY_DN50264_c0_g1_i1:111-1391(-)